MNKNLLALLGIAPVLTPLHTLANDRLDPRPNIIFFLVDDMGWQDTSLPFWTEKTMYNERYETPNMERLARQGMMFTQAYASSISSPTRCSLMTGANAARHRVTNWTLQKNKTTDAQSEVLQLPDWNYNGIAQVEGTNHTFVAKSFVQYLKDSGYHTIHCGKAHWGAIDTPGENPCHFGFETNIAGHAAGGLATYLSELNYGHDEKGNPTSLMSIPGLEKYWKTGTFVTEALTQEALKALDKAKEYNQPFYLYMSHYAIHIPIDKDMRFYDKYKKKGMSDKEAAYASLIEGMDKSLGDIMDWLEKNGEAIYDTDASPFREQYEWGAITRKENTLYLILSGKYPLHGEIILNTPGFKLKEAKGNYTHISQKKGNLHITVPQTAYNNTDIEVLSLDMDVTTPIAATHEYVPNYSYSCFDYYSNYRSTVSYEWEIPNRNTQLELTYTPQEIGKELVITNPTGNEQRITLDGAKASPLKVNPKTKWGKRYLCGPGSSLFDAPSTINISLDKTPVRNGQWKETNEEKMMFPANILETYFVMQEVESPVAQDVLVDVGAGNGIEVYLNGRSVMKHLNPYRCKFREEKVLLHLQKGLNQIVLRLYNRFEKETGYLLRPSDKQIVYKQRYTYTVSEEDKKQPAIKLQIKQNNLPTQHTDTELHNLTVRIK